MLRFALVESGALVEASGAERIVPWWSFGKTVLAAAALALVRDGRLSLDDPLRDRPYTLRQLLQHRAGLTDYGRLSSYHEAVASGEAPWPVSTMLVRADADRLFYEPGQGWDYSNIGYLLVGRLIEEVAACPLAEAVAALVFLPLGIQEARLALSPENLGDVDLGLIDRYHPGWVYHGLFVGTLPDAALLLQRLLTTDFLPAALRAEMQTPYRLPGRMPGRPWKTPGYGLGVMSGETRYGARVVGHTGGGPGSVCAIYHLPESSPPRTAAAFLAGDGVGRVECAAIGRAVRRG